MLGDRFDIQQAEAIEFRNGASTSTAVLWNNLSLVEVMNFLLIYAGAFMLKHSVGFIDARSTSIDKDVMWTGYLRSRSFDTYTLHMLFAYPINKNKNVVHCSRLRKFMEQNRARSL